IDPRRYMHVLYCCFSVLFFFFSSRRRHTRCYRDWSSDVCSSDLDATSSSDRGGTDHALNATRAAFAIHQKTLRLNEEYGGVFQRSEERRVGKESRTRGSQDD